MITPTFDILELLDILEPLDIFLGLKQFGNVYFIYFKSSLSYKRKVLSINLGILTEK